MSERISLEVENTISSIMRTAELAALYGDEASKNVDNYKKLIEQALQIKKSFERQRNAIQYGRECENMAEFLSMYDDVRNRGNTDDVKETSEYKNCISQVQDVLQRTQHEDSLNSADAGNSGATVERHGEIISEGILSDIDPFTKRRMRFPVKNMACGHYYEKDSVLSCLRVNGHLRCPIPGCANRSYILANNLIEDKAFGQRLRAQNEDDEDEDD